MRATVRRTEGSADHHAQDGSRAARLVAIVCAVSMFMMPLMIPADAGVRGTVPRPGRPAASVLRLGLLARTTTAQPFPGVAAVGALFTETGGKLGSHFCTASVVHSAAGDLAVTAAHCVSDQPGPIVFVPGYADGRIPLGIWRVTKVYTDSGWQTSQNPDDDAAFLRLADASGGVPIEDVTGAERLAIDQPAGQPVQVVGYPNAGDEPVWCGGVTKSFSPTQLEFDCGGYTVGTSGGPFLTRVSPATGQGTVVAVIGGYEQGGDTPSVSYAAIFSPAVAALYRQAESGS